MTEDEPKMEVMDLRLPPTPPHIDALFHALSYMNWGTDKSLTIQEAITATKYVLDYLDRRGMEIRKKELTSDVLP